MRRRASTDPSVRTTLGPRQRQVLELIAAGRTNAQIADELGLSLDGAKWHVREIFLRLGVESREEAVRIWCDQQGGLGKLPSWMWRGGVALAGGALCVAIGSIVLAALGGSLPMGSSGSDEGTQRSTAEVAPSLENDPERISQRQSQPELQEAESGQDWRMLIAEGGSQTLNAGSVVLAVNFDGPFEAAGPNAAMIPPHIDVIGPDGRIAMRLETGYRPMPRLNSVNNTLVLSDVVLDGEASYARVLVFALDRPRLVGDVRLPYHRVNFTTFGNAVTLSPDGRWLYWVEHAHQPEPESCQVGGDERVCDRMVIHAVDLEAMANSTMAVDMPRACGVPAMVPYAGSSVLGTCQDREGSRWIIDATSTPHARAAPATAPLALARYLWSVLGNVALDLAYTNVGSLTSARLVDRTTGVELAKQPLPNAHGALLVDERTLLVHLSDGSLLHLDMYTGVSTPLPYSLDAGPQGLSVVFVR